MTLVVGVNLGFYALLAGDCRETVFFQNQAKPTINDEFCKVIQTPIGLATGAGLTAVVFKVIAELSGHPEVMADPEQVSEYMRDFQGGFMTTAPAHVKDERVIPQLTRVGWIFSSLEGGQLQVRLYHSDYSFEPMSYPEGTPCSLLPPDIPPERSRPAETQLMKALRVSHNERDLDASLEHNLSVLAKYFRRQAKISSVLGPAIHVGYHTRDGETEITEALELSGIR